MITISPLEASELLAAGCLDARVIVAPPEDGKIHIAYRAKSDRQVYVMVVAGDNDWLSLFLSAPTSTFTAYVARDLRDFNNHGLQHWPADQSMLRLKAMLDFRAGAPS